MSGHVVEEMGHGEGDFNVEAGGRLVLGEEGGVEGVGAGVGGRRIVGVGVEEGVDGELPSF